jgi:hypothetical protein
VNGLEYQVVGCVGFHNSIFSYRPPSFNFHSEKFQAMNPLDDTAVHCDRGVAGVTFWSASIASTEPLIDRDGFFM